MWPFNDIGGALGGAIKDMIASAFEAAMTAIWDASLAVLRGAFTLADKFSVFSVDTRTGPIAILWPMMLWISGVLALGLFFWQLIMTNLRGGRGFLRLIGGPVQYGIALSVTVGLVASFLAAVDGLTDGILRYGLQSANFTDALEHTTFGDTAVDGIKAVVLGICALVGVIPAAIGYVLEMLFREAAIYVLVATIPITAAGLLANVTASWFWRTCRWLLACIAMKPVLALTLVLGVAIAGGSDGLSGLLAGVGVLVISLFAPFVLFRLFAFVDPNTDAGGAFRDALSGAGVDSYGPNNPASMAAGALGGGSGGGGGAMEDANTGRFDQAVADRAGNSMDDSGVGDSSGSSGAKSDEGSDSDGNPGGGGDEAGGGATAPPASSGQATSSGPDPSGSDDGGNSGGGDEPPPEIPGSDGGPPAPPNDDDDGGGGGSRGSGPKSGGSGGGGAAAGEADAAVIV